MVARDLTLLSICPFVRHVGCLRVVREIRARRPARCVRCHTRLSAGTVQTAWRLNCPHIGVALIKHFMQADAIEGQLNADDGLHELGGLSHGDHVSGGGQAAGIQPGI